MSNPAQRIPPQKPAHLDPVWEGIRRDAQAMQQAEPLMASLVHEHILARKSFEAALAARLAAKLAVSEIREATLRLRRVSARSGLHLVFTAIAVLQGVHGAGGVALRSSPLDE